MNSLPSLMATTGAETNLYYGYSNRNCMASETARVFSFVHASDYSDSGYVYCMAATMPTSPEGSVRLSKGGVLSEMGSSRISNNTAVTNILAAICTWVPQVISLL